jgi:hypothetical protein
MRQSGFDPGRFVLHESHFEHKSLLHGINHTYRVMCHVLYLGKKLRWERETRLAFCAAFIHDMSRLHDGYCTKHGHWAARDKLPVFNEFFLSQGANSFEIEEIKAAVTNHSEGFELPTNHRFRKTAALLKDADALDRIRLGDKNLDPSFLRFDFTIQFVTFANALFHHSDHLKIAKFDQMLEIAGDISNLLPRNLR